jgi:hypothetical protein
MTEIPWKDHIKIDKTWIDRQLIHQVKLLSEKLSISVYSVAFSGNLNSCSALISELTLLIKQFVYGDTEIAKIGNDKALLESLRYFGDKDPLTDGKYGELFLFALVESVLQCKMIAHKIRVLSNFQDQVKGGDGIFLGSYSVSANRSEPAFLIGESKIMGSRAGSVKDSILSLQRFHDMKNDPSYLTSEFLVARNNILLDENIDAEELYDLLNPVTEAFKKQIIVHPILLVFDSEKIETIETEATSKEDAENMMRIFIKSEEDKIKKYINKLLKEFPELKKVHLEFFLIPLKSVNDFREAFYKSIHNTTFKR